MERLAIKPQLHWARPGEMRVTCALRACTSVRGKTPAAFKCTQLVINDGQMALASIREDLSPTVEWLVPSQNAVARYALVVTGHR